MEYTTIKIPNTTYEAAKKLQAEFAKRGISNLPVGLKTLAEDNKCPFCKLQMEELKLSIYKCKKCGYSRQRFNLSSSDADDILKALALGAIIVLGVAAVASLLSGK